MPKKQEKFTPVLLLMILACLGLEVCLAQYQVNMQVNTQVNRGIYAGPNLGSMQYNSQNMTQNPLLPSQQRYQTMQSGLLPSENRYGVMRAGPLAPVGTLTYLPGTPLSRAVGTPPPNPTGALAVPSRPAYAPTGSMTFSKSYSSNWQNLQVSNARPVNASANLATPLPGPISPSLMGAQPISGSIMYNNGPGL